MKDWVIQWSQLASRWECLTCGGISLSRDFDTMTHQTSTETAERLRAKYLTASGESKDRFTKPNVLFHRTGCKFIQGEGQ